MSDRLSRIVLKLQEIAADLSGYGLEDVDPTTTFLELGFDSLFLTQLATAYKKQLGVEVTFRQLFDALPTMAALGAHIDATLPPDRLPPEAPAEIVAVAPEPPAQVQVVAPIRAAGPSAGANIAAAEGMEALFVQQLQLMSEQLALLTGGQPALRATPAITAPAPAAQPSVKSKPPAAPTAPENAQPTVKLPAGFGPGEQTPTGLPPLPPRHQQHLDALIESYTRRTAGSKERTQRFRKAHADPRTAAGFNRRWKEMIYPIWVERSLGSKLWDVDGNEYIDILNGFGPNFLGHSPPYITKALHEQLDRGVEIGPQMPLVGEVSEIICELTGMERVSFMCTGSEAVQAVQRIARTKTGRDKVVVFSGDYHGNFDQVLVRAANRGDKLRTFPLAPGIPFQSVDDTYVLEYGTEQSLEIIASFADDIAAVLVEPVQSRRPEFQPTEFLRALRKLTRDKGICLIFDEVITGFRIEPGGAQAYYGVDADMATYGKVIGGGMPIGIVAGRSEWMDTLDGGHWQFGDTSFPEAGVTFFAGTFVRHPLAIVAARETLRYLVDQGPDLQKRINAKASRFCGQLNELFQKHDIQMEVPHFSSQMYIRNKEDNDLATLLFYHVRNKGVHLLEGFPSYMTDAHTEQDIDHLVNAFTEGVESMVEAGIFGRQPERRQVSAATPFPLTAGQREIWFASQLSDGAACAYNESDTLSLRGNLHEDVLVSAVKDVLARHDALHLRFAADGASQHISDSRAIEVPVLDLSTLDPAGRLAARAKLLTDEATTPFDLANGPLVRVHLIRLEDQHHELVLYGNHLVFDGWSSGIVFDEIALAYNARVQDDALDLPEASSFREYAALESVAEATGARQQACAHWANQFAQGIPDGLDLPASQPRPNTRSFDGATVKWRLRDSVYRGVKQTAVEHKTSMFAVLLAAYKVLLARLSRQRDLVIGVSVAGQAMVDMPALVGHGVNLIPLRVTLDDDQPFSDLMAATKSEVLDIWDHAGTTLGDVLRELNVPRVAGRAPLIEAMFNFSTAGAHQEFAGLETTIGENSRRHVNFDLFANLLETDGALTADWDYNTSLFDEGAVRRWIGYFETLLEGVVASSSSTISSLALLTDSQRAQLAYGWNDDTKRPVVSTCVHLSFAEQATRTPDAVAVQVATSDQSAHSGPQLLTYAELDRRSNQLAHRLRELGVDANVRVAVCMERSCELVVAALGILKAGGAYVPVDPEFPPDRVAYMLDDSQAPVVVSERRTSAALAHYQGENVVVDAERDALDARPADTVDSAVGAADLAYVIYTSGSTGRPKGVEVPHGCLANFLDSMARQPGLNSDDVLLAVTTLSFDISGLELFLPLVTGARCVVADVATATDGAELLQAIQGVSATVMQATPATWRLLIEAGWQAGTSLSKVLCGGEALPVDLARELVARAPEVWNMYGPTETTIWSTCHRVAADEAPVLVGLPIANTQVYVLDDQRKLVPPDVVGELYIGGHGVVRGYSGRPELTERNFVDNPFVPGARMYRTGDLARRRTDGNMQILGRVDDQVKLRGFRIELGEIEAVLTEVPGVSRAVATVWHAGPADDRLVAYVVPTGSGDTDAATLREHLRGRLPEYMMPQHYVALEQIPMTPNNKVARKALTPPSGAAVDTGNYVAPSTPVETSLAELWASVLGVERPGAADDFFDLGGHSLLAARMLSRAERELEVTLSLRSFFAAPTIQGLADLVEAQRYVARAGGEDAGDIETLEI